jgi:hypothetical protein
MRASVRSRIPHPRRATGVVQCDGQRHRLYTYKGKVHFANHAIQDLQLMAALDSHCTCADILHALRTSEKRDRLASLLPARLFNPLALYLRHRTPSPPAGSWPDQCHTLLRAAIDRRFAPLLDGLHDLGFDLSIDSCHDRSRVGHAITLYAGNIALGHFAHNGWHLSLGQIATMARSTTAYGKPHPSWGDDTCRVCAQPPQDSLSDAFDAVEELPGPSARWQTITQHAQSRAHLYTIRQLLEDTFGPESLCAVPA